MGNTLLEFRYVLFCWSIDLIDVKDFKRNLTDGYLIKNVFKGNLMLQFSWLEKFHWRKVSVWWTLDELQYENGFKDQL